MITSIRFLTIILVALITGAQFGVWFGYNPKHFSVSTYLEQQQGAIRGLNTLMPVLGLVSIVLTLLSAFLQREDRSIFSVLLIAAAFLLTSGLVTRFGNQPINKVVMTWTMDNVPANWTDWRDKWWSLHIVRTLTSFLSLILLVWSGVKKG